MKRKIFAAMLLSVFLLSAMTVPALSQYDWDIGVQVGDSFKFVGTLLSWEESGGISFPPMGAEFLQTYNESNWMEYTITDIEALNVTYDVTTHWKNGTETVSTITENITSSSPPTIIGANLEEGTEIRPESLLAGQTMPARYLNVPVMREYESGQRETNVVILDMDIFGNVYQIKALFDKETGMLVYRENSVDEASDFMTEGTYSYNATLELIETNIESWTVIPEFPTGTVMLLIFVAVTACVGIYRRKKLKGHIG
jgi:hypothetical protein